MTLNKKIIDEKLQYDDNRETAQISALSSCKTDKCDYLMCEEISPDPSQIIQVKFTYSPLDKERKKSKQIS